MHGTSELTQWNVRVYRVTQQSVPLNNVNVLDYKVVFFGIKALEPRCTLKWTLLLELCTFDSSETCSNQLSMVKTIYMDTKINPFLWQGADLHICIGPGS